MKTSSNIDLSTATIKLDAKGKICRAWLWDVFGQIRTEASEALVSAARKADSAEESMALRNAATQTLQAWVALNGRLKTVAGRAHCLENQPNFGKVEISTKIFSHDSVTMAQLVETIKHEIAHVAAGYRAAHGAQWKRIYRLMGGNGEQFHDMKAAAEAARPARVKGEITCDRCSNILGHVTRRGEGHISNWVKGRRSNCCRAHLTYSIVNA